jgi:hypothetical protein
MPRKLSSAIDGRLRSVARPAARRVDVRCVPEFGKYRKTGYRIFSRYRERGLAAAGKLCQPVAGAIPCMIATLS